MVIMYKCEEENFPLLCSLPSVFRFSIPDNYQSMCKQIKTPNMAIDACQTDFTPTLKLVQVSTV